MIFHSKIKTQKAIDDFSHGCNFISQEHALELELENSKQRTQHPSSDSKLVRC